MGGWVYGPNNTVSSSFVYYMGTNYTLGSNSPWNEQHNKT